MFRRMFLKMNAVASAALATGAGLLAGGAAGCGDDSEDGGGDGEGGYGNGYGTSALQPGNDRERGTWTRIG